MSGERLDGTVAYAMTTYCDLPMLRRLVDRLTADPTTAGVAIHHDAASGPLEVTFARPDLVAVVPDPVDVQWGNWTQVVAQMAAVGLAVRTFGSARWFVTLSGQDYPAVPLDQIAATLAGSGYDAYVESVPVTERFLQGARWRYGYLYYRVPSFLGPKAGRRAGQLLSKFPLLFSGAWWYPEKHGKFVAIRNPRAKITSLLGGSDWIMVNRRAAEALLGRFTTPGVQRFWSHTMIPSEAFYASELAATPMLVCSDPRRFTDFPHAEAAHPRTLVASDLPALEASGALFARKVDSEVSVELLALLDARPADIAP